MIFLFLLAAFPLLAAEILDHEMSSQDRKVTGISKLRDKEKAALYDWIDTYYEKREQPKIGRESSLRSSLQDNLQNGTLIRLANGSLWKIKPEDTNLSQGWITPVDILIASSNDKEFPHRLTNSMTGSSIRAKLDSSETP